MMRSFVKAVIGCLVLTAVWYGAWYWMMRAPVAQVNASIAYQNAAFKKVNSFTVLKAERVSADGFPFAFRVKITRPTLSVISEPETYAVSLPYVWLERTDNDPGRYRVLWPEEFEALYASNGAAPENYRIKTSPMPEVQLEAAHCNPAGGGSCPLPFEHEPLVNYAAMMPRDLTLHIERDGKSKEVGFHFMPLPLPIFATIPPSAANPLEIFVRMLREAMVYTAP